MSEIDNLIARIAGRARWHCAISMISSYQTQELIIVWCKLAMAWLCVGVYSDSLAANHHNDQGCQLLDASALLYFTEHLCLLDCARLALC